MDELNRTRLQAIPKEPGVYLFKDALGAVLYIGKAKNLRNRVGTYFSGGDGREHVRYLIECIADVETIQTRSEREALVLEADLVGKFKPKYNIRLKDDKSQLLIKLDRSSEWPRFEIVRKRENDGSKYFGPFAFGHEARTLFEVLDRVLPLRNCSDTMFRNRVRPCLQYQIKRCAAPCCLEVSKVDYQSWIDQGLSLLEGQTGALIKVLEGKMDAASAQMMFEDAAELRDRIDVLQRLKDDKRSGFYGDETMDAFALHDEITSIEVSVLRTFDGRLRDSKTFGFSETIMDSGELLGSVVFQFYIAQKHEIPAVILLSHEIPDLESLEQLLREKRGSAVSIHFPQRGRKRKLMDLALSNAQKNYEERFCSDTRIDRVLEGLQDVLKLENQPRVIACADVSHFQGSDTVASVVVFKDGVPQRKSYRVFLLSQEGKPDDFASMNEVLRRYLSRGIEENSLPDLLIVDGGPPQLREAELVKAELSLEEFPIAALAKKRAVSPQHSQPRKLSSSTKPERIYIAGKNGPIILPARSEVLRLLEQLRNEAHRTAVTFHRERRKKRMFNGPLDGIPGLGAQRKKKLVSLFGSIRELAASEADEIAEKGKIPYSLAVRILTELKRRL